MNYLLCSTVVLSVACVASYSEKAREYLDSICRTFNNEIGRVSTSVPKRLAFNLGILIFFGLACYGQFALYMHVACGGEDSDGEGCDSAVHAVIGGILCFLSAFLVSKLVVKTVMIGKKLLSGRQRSQSLDNYWRNVFPHEQLQERTKPPPSQHSCFPTKQKN